jgi:O-antigen ligase
MAIGFGFWLYLHTRVNSTTLTILVSAWMWMGVLAAYARGPWVVAVALFFAFLALVPKGSGLLFKALFVFALVAGVVLVSPLGPTVIDNLPFVGSVDAHSVTYRERLAEMSWELFQRNPFFGDPFFMDKMEAMRNATGIIDLVNTYAQIALSNGVVGLLIFLGPLLLGMLKVYSLARRFARTDRDLSLLGMNLIACVLATLLMIATASFGAGIAILFWVLTGLAAGYAQVGAHEEKVHSGRSYEDGQQLQ